MYKKNIGHVIAVSLKYFFDLDYTLFSHTFLIALLMAGFLKMFMKQIMVVLYDGLRTLKEDALNIKGALMTLKENWNNSLTREALINNLRYFRNNS